MSGEPVSGDPVLLVDDLSDSRWTLTVAGAVLRETGSGPVTPVRAGEGRERLAGLWLFRWVRVLVPRTRSRPSC